MVDNGISGNGGSSNGGSTRGEREEPGSVRQISPRTVAIGIALGAIIGATAVFITGSVLHARDREQLASWESQALPLIQRAEQIHQEMPAVERAIARAPSPTAGRAARLSTRVQGFRTELQVIKRRLDSTQLPEILMNVAAASYSGVTRSLQAVTAMERELAAAPVRASDREPFHAAWERARDRFALGETLLIRLRCRARVERCATLPFEPARV